MRCNTSNCCHAFHSIPEDKTTFTYPSSRSHSRSASARGQQTEMVGLLTTCPDLASCCCVVSGLMFEARLPFGPFTRRCYLVSDWMSIKSSHWLSIGVLILSQLRPGGVNQALDRFHLLTDFPTTNFKSRQHHQF